MYYVGTFGFPMKEDSLDLQLALCLAVMINWWSVRVYILYDLQLLYTPSTVETRMRHRQSVKWSVTS
jgi:hypothetical protein